jgi:SpoVK/Ycf46/Vps4 family AAA+-type ATPase
MNNTWYQEKFITSSDRENYVGNKEIIDEILHVINMHKKHSEFLKKIDESKSINILLYGPPGCGKTSLWKLIASLTERTVGIVSHHSISAGKFVFSPDKKYNINTIIVEDFDRWFKIRPDMDIAQILNSLDGIDDNSSYLRFFTCNDPTLIEENKALLDRFYATYYIGIPTRDAVSAKVNKILSFYEINDINKVNKFIDLIVEKKLGNIRKLVHYMIKYLFDENYLDKMIENIDKLDTSLLNLDYEIKK